MLLDHLPPLPGPSIASPFALASRRALTSFSFVSTRDAPNENDPDGLSTYRPYMNPRTMEPPKTLPSFVLPSREPANRSRIVHGLLRSSSARRSSSSRLACRPQYTCTTYAPYRHATKNTRKPPKKNNAASLDPMRDIPRAPDILNPRVESRERSDCPENSDSAVSGANERK